MFNMILNFEITYQQTVAKDLIFIIKLPDSNNQSISCKIIP